MIDYTITSASHEALATYADPVAAIRNAGYLAELFGALFTVTRSDGAVLSVASPNDAQVLAARSKAERANSALLGVSLAR
jgi:hypothetical protein